MKKIVVIQSNYIPWKGYFDLIASADEFIILDEVQFTKRDWRNRNQIKTPNGLLWLTIPTITKGKFFQKISETQIADTEWEINHWKTIQHNYKKAPYFTEIAKWLEPLYIDNKIINLSLLNQKFISEICNYLNISTQISASSEYTLDDDKSARLAHLTLQASGNIYVSGPSAKNYIDENIFKKNNIQLDWFDYSGYTEYNQLWGKFIHNVSILDLLFNCGPEASKYMKYLK